MHKFFVFLFCLFIGHLAPIFGQEIVAQKNVQDYTPSVLIDADQTEFKWFNNLYTQTQYFDEEGSRQDGGGRSTFFTSIFEYNYGVSSGVTLGGELWLRSVYEGTTESSMNKALEFSNSDHSRAGINLVGMKIKFNPIKRWGGFTAQSALLLSVISDPESEQLDRPFLDNNRHLWITKLYVDKKLSSKFQAFTQLSFWVSIDKNLASENMGLAVPIELFLTYFPTKKISIYLQNQFWPSIGEEGLSSYFLQEGLGLKYQLFNGVELEASYTSFVIGKDTGAGQTFNLGLRILH